MHQIVCPHCNEAFVIDESAYHQIVSQIKDAELAEAVDREERRLRESMQRDFEVERMKLTQAQEARERELREERSETVHAYEQQIATLSAELATHKDRASKALTDAELVHHQELSRLQAELMHVRTQLTHQQDQAESQKQLALAQLTQEKDQTLQSVREQHALETRKWLEEKQQLTQDISDQQRNHQEALVLLKAEKDGLIRDQAEEIERLKSMKMKLSTKLLGESLEQHCENEFERWRALGFRGAEFYKDNAVVANSKGDYIFRECDDEGNEIISIMFEMKHQNDETRDENRHKNADFFKKLDQDRRNKHCEYAVLVSTLEAESELYNAGIVDVSHHFEKMYVIRPQFFIPMIGLLRNAALNAVAVRKELAQIRQQNIDITNFEAQLEDFKERFGKNYQTAASKFDAAIKEIDKSIAALQKVRDNLTSSERQLKLALDKADGLTIRKLTYKNPTMKARFAEARTLASSFEGSSDCIDAE